MERNVPAINSITSFAVVMQYLLEVLPFAEDNAGKGYKKEQDLSTL